MTSLDPSHIPHIAGRDRHVGDPATVNVRHRARSDSHSDSSKHGNIAAIPDLRFEQSYLKSIAPYVHIRTVESGSDGSGRVDHIDVQWKQVLWITARDQLVSPLIQGAVWGVAQLFVRPLFANIRSFFGSFFSFSRRASGVKTAQPFKPKVDGERTRRLREWSKGLAGGLETNVALAK